MECCLGNGELMRLAGGQSGVVLRCLRGTLWLTIGDGRDYLVHQGRCFRLASGASALVEALGSTEFSIRPASFEAASIKSAASVRSVA